MLKPAPDSASTEAAFDCRATAALLKSIGGLEWASHLAAVLAISKFKWLPLLAWGFVLYLSVRVRLDTQFLEMLADDPEGTPSKLDEWLSMTGLRSRRAERSIEDRCKGARDLAHNLVYALLLQFLVTALAVWGYAP